MEFRRITDRRTAVLRQAMVRPLALRWTRWAESLLRRHAVGSAAWYLLNAILRETAGRGETLVDRRSSLAFGLYLTIPAARVMLALAVSPDVRAGSTGRGARVSRPVVSFRAATPSDRITPVIQQARLEQQYHDDTSALAVLRQSDLRIVNRHTLAAVERIYARQGQRYEAWGGVPPLTTQIVRQPDTAAQVSPAQSNSFAADSAFKPILHWDSAAVGAAPADITRLTDQVIQSIDQRLTASRERYGKR